MELLGPIVLHTLHISLPVSVSRGHAKGDVHLENALSDISCHGVAAAPLAVGRGRQVSPGPAPCRGERLVCAADTLSPGTRAGWGNTSCCWTLWLVTGGVCAWGDWAGRAALPKNANQNNGVDKITAVHCLWAAEIHRGLMFSGKLHVQCVSRSNIRHLGFPPTALMSARN